MTAIGTRTTRVGFTEPYLNWRRCLTAIESDGGDNAGVILWLAKLLEDDAWKSFRGETWPEFASFAEFVRERDHGLNMEPADLLLLINVRGSTEAHGRWDGELFESVRERVAELLGAPAGVRERLLAAIAS